ncbi:MAG: hypothetical protein RMM17_12920, partial [Acidobacteriota bacterium]|nr:hypothetical protein [Acidobacteriota bacterium]
APVVPPPPAATPLSQQKSDKPSSEVSFADIFAGKPPQQKAPTSPSTATPTTSPLQTQKAEQRSQTAFEAFNLFPKEEDKEQKAPPPQLTPKPGMQLRNPNTINFESSLFGTKPEEIKGSPQEIFAPPAPPPAPTKEAKTSSLVFSMEELANATPAIPSKPTTGGPEPSSKPTTASGEPKSAPFATPSTPPPLPPLPPLPTGQQPDKPSFGSATGKPEPKAGPEALASIFSAAPPQPPTPPQSVKPPASGLTVAETKSPLPPLPPLPPVTASSGSGETAKSGPLSSKPGVLYIPDEKEAASAPPVSKRLDPYKSLPIFSTAPDKTNPPPPLPTPTSSSTSSAPPLGSLSKDLTVPSKPSLPPNLPIRIEKTPTSPSATPSTATPPPLPQESNTSVESKVSEIKFEPTPLKKLDLPEIPKKVVSSSSVTEKNSKLIVGIAAAVIVILAIGFLLIPRIGSSKDPTQLPAESSNMENKPKAESPLAPMSPANSSSSAQQQPTAGQPTIPTDTKERIKYALEEINKTTLRVQSVMPDSDPLKQMRLNQLNAFREQLQDYLKKGIVTDEAKAYADSAISQLIRLNSQLDLLPPPKEKVRKQR